MTKIKPYILTSLEWDLLTPEERDECYNGMGPACWPQISRDILDWLFDILEDGVRVHDVDFTYGKKSIARFKQANTRMKENFIRAAKKEIPLWRFWKRRRFLKYWIPLLYVCVDCNKGWEAFKAAKPPIKGKHNG